MKRIAALLIALVVILGSVSALADDTGIQIISGPEVKVQAVNMEDFKVGDMVDIPGFGEVTFVKASWESDISRNFYSGDEAIYLQLQLEILNTQKEPVMFYDMFSNIVCTYKEEYQFGGWLRQHKNSLSEYVLSDAEGKPVDVMYRGRYSIVITLPMDVYTRTTTKANPDPLTVSFKLGENEFTYIHRP